MPCDMMFTISEQNNFYFIFFTKFGFPFTYFISEFYFLYLIWVSLVLILLVSCEILKL